MLEYLKILHDQSSDAVRDTLAKIPRISNPLTFKLMLGGFGVLALANLGAVLTLAGGAVGIGAVIAFYGLVLTAYVLGPFAIVMAAYLTITCKWHLFFRWWLEMIAGLSDRKAAVTSSRRYDPAPSLSA